MAVLIAAVITATGLGYSLARTPGRGLSRLEAQDERDTILIAEGHQPPSDMGLRVHRLTPIVLLWALTLGRPAAMPFAALAIAIAGNLMLAWVIAPLLPKRVKWAAGLVILMPPLFWSFEHLLPTSLGLAFAIWGWRSNNKWLLLAGGFVHETLLAFALVRRQIVPIAVWIGWAIIAAFFWTTGAGGVFGVFSVFTTYGSSSWIHYVVLGATILCGVLAFKVDRALAILYLLFLCVIGPFGARYWHDFARLVAPLWALGFVGGVSLLEDRIFRPRSLTPAIEVEGRS